MPEMAENGTVSMADAAIQGKLVTDRNWMYSLPHHTYTHTHSGAGFTVRTAC